MQLLTASRTSTDFCPGEGKIFPRGEGAKKYFLPKKHHKDTILVEESTFYIDLPAEMPIYYI
jgi:hypothetical protein